MHNSTLAIRTRAANLISNILNPFLISLIVILLLSFESAGSVLEALKWVLILVTVTIIPTYLIIVYLVKTGRIKNYFIDVRRQRTKVYIPAGICTLISIGILFYLGAPLLLLAAVVAGFVTVIIFMILNIWWKISLHAAFMAGATTVSVVLYGYVATAGLVLLLLAAWSRIELGRHSVAQVAVGALLSTVVMMAVLYLFRLV